MIQAAPIGRQPGNNIINLTQFTMKTLILQVLCLFLFTTGVYSQKDACCEDKTAQEQNVHVSDAPDKMVSFSRDEEFRSAHPEPVVFNLTGGSGNMITFKTSGGADANAYEVKSETPSNNWVFIFHEWYGLNDYIKKEAEETALELGNVNVLAIDLYDGNVAANSDEAMKYMQQVDNMRAVNIIKGAMDYAGSDAVFASYGWCFGGTWSNQAAIEMGDRCKACVIYYGMPEQNPERLALLKAPVLGIFAKKDKRITPEIAAQFETDLKSLNIPADIYIYDAVHAFANPSNPNHDAVSAKDAKEKTYTFLKEKLK